MSNKTVLIIGFGDIGAACGRLIRAFGTKVIGLKRNTLTIKNTDCADEIHGVDKLDEKIAEADFVIGVLPQTSETYHFFNAGFFSKMK